MSPSVFSSESELSRIAEALAAYARMPLTAKSIPGAWMEAVLAEVRGGEALPTYDFVDVVKREDKIGWQVKSTLRKTPITWKRAKLPNIQPLIDESLKDEDACQELGDAVINFCNEHVAASIDKYELNEIGYSRLIVDAKGATYFEKAIATSDNPKVFLPEEFYWEWSKPKVTRSGGKEQLRSLHGFLRESENRWFAWHGLGENQLHFTGERFWHPPQESDHRISFAIGREKLSIGEFAKRLVD